MANDRGAASPPDAQRVAQFVAHCERLSLHPKPRLLAHTLPTLFDGVRLEGKDVLDVGGGTGIYSLFTSFCGARSVVCLEPEAAQRYPSAAHLAFDLSHPEQITVTERGTNITGTNFRTHFKRWLKAAGMHYKPSPMASQQIDEVPIVMVAVPHVDVTDATLYSLRQAVARSLGTRPGARLACVTVISSGLTSTSDEEKSETQVHRRYLTTLRQWAQPLDHPGHQTSFHVLESGDVAQALLDYARGNNVSVIVMGAATHGLKTQRFVATVPIKVAMEAPCTIILVKQSLPFELLGDSSSDNSSDMVGYSDSAPETVRPRKPYADNDVPF